MNGGPRDSTGLNPEHLPPLANVIFNKLADTFLAVTRNIRMAHITRGKARELSVAIIVNTLPRVPSTAIRLLMGNSVDPEIVSTSFA